MTRLQKLLLRQSELRTELGELLDLETRSGDQESRRGVIVGELRGMERDIRDARLAEPEPETRFQARSDTDPEERERLELRSAFRVGNVVAAMIGNRPLVGREAEYLAVAEEVDDGGSSRSTSSSAGR